MGFVSDFLDAIEYLIQKYQKECTTIYSGTVQSVSDKSCSMNVNGNVYNKIAYYGVAPIVGNSYRVFVPFNNMSLAFIIVPSTTTSGSSGVSSVNGKTGNVVLNAADVGVLSSTTVIPSKTSQLENDSGFIKWDSIDLTNAELDPSLGTWEEYILGVYKLNVADYPDNYVVGAMITQFTDGGNATGKIPQVMLINGTLSIMVASDAPVRYDSIQILVAHI